MKKLAFLVLMFLLLTACGVNSVDEFKEVAEIHFDDSQVMVDLDSHSGFHGDGSQVIKVDYVEEPIAEKLMESTHWRRLPLSKEAEILVYGDGEQGPFIDYDTVGFKLQKVENGFYFFYNRQEVEDAYDESLALHNSSVNFTMGIYDSDEDLLYILASDS